MASLWKFEAVVAPLLYCLLCCLATSSPRCYPQDRHALLAIKAYFSPSVLDRSWKGSECCEWAFVNCTEDYRVKAVQLYGLGSGPSISSAFCELSMLQVLNLSGCLVQSLLPSGSIPSCVCKLPLLQVLDLSQNRLGGSIPACLGELPLLRVLELSGNVFGGSIPASLCELPLLRVLGLSSLYMSAPADYDGNPYPGSDGGTGSGTGGSIPACLCKLKMLQSLDLSYNWLQESIPSCVGDLFELTMLDVTYNSLEGGIPSSLCKLRNLSSLHLRGNPLQGNIPACLGDLSELTDLDLGENYLGGGIPSSLGNLRKLSSLSLNNNMLGGGIPSSLGNLRKLSSLSLNNNMLAGTVPSSICGLGRLDALDLSSNLFEAVPACLSNLTRLTSLFIGGQGSTSSTLRFTSQVIDVVDPFSEGLCKLSNLQWLSLSWSGLNGTLPSCLAQLRNLQGLYLDGNHFRGSIPPEWAALTQLVELSLSNNHQLQIGQLPTLPASLYLYLRSCGISSFSCNHLSQELNELDLANNQLSIDAVHCLFHPRSQLTTLDLSGNPLNFSLQQTPMIQLPGNLVTLNLSFCGLKGHLSPDFLGGNQSNLFDVDLSRNEIDGVITSDAFETLPFLTSLRLSGNRFTGALPPSLGNTLSRIGSLDLSQNLFQGRLPPSLGQCTFVSFLNFGDNGFEGAIPHELGQLPYLQTLSLSGNNLSGQVPSFKNASALQVLDLGNNNLGGTLQDLGLSNLYNLQVPSFRNASALQVLDLRNNKLEGTLQDLGLSNLYNLRVLILTANRLGGSIQNSLADVSRILQVIDLSYNNLTGSIPRNLLLPAFSLPPTATFRNVIKTVSASRSYYDTGTLYEEIRIAAKGQSLNYTYVRVDLVALILKGNSFTGTIPDSFGDLSSIMFLDLSQNLLTGEIPASLSKLEVLESLDLSQNSLTGSIPANFSALTALEFFNVSDNNLSGPIPQGGQFATTFDAQCYKDNPGLCGNVGILEQCNQTMPPQQQSHTPLQSSLSKLARFVKFVKEDVPVASLCLGYLFGLVVSFWLFNRGPLEVPWSFWSLYKGMIGALPSSVQETAN